MIPQTQPRPGATRAQSSLVTGFALPCPKGNPAGYPSHGKQGWKIPGVGARKK